MDSRFKYIPRLAADMLTALLGIWAIYSQVLSAAGKNFDFLLSTVWLPGLAFVLTGIWLCRNFIALPFQSAAKSATSDASAPLSKLSANQQWLLIALLIPVGIGFHFELRWVLWCACAFYLGFLIYWTGISVPSTPSEDLHASSRDWAALIIFFVIAAAISLIFSRANYDDGYYLNAVVSSIDHSHLALLNFDGMHDDLSMPPHLITQTRQTYEILIATVATLTGLAAWAVYYLWAPVFFTAFIGVANWLLLKRWLGEKAWLAVLVVLAVLVIWDAGGRSFGVWSFTMLYTAKTVLLTVMVPLIIHYTLELIGRQDLRTWLLLFLAQSAALSFSSSGTYVGVIAVGFAVLAGFRFGPGSFRIIALLSAALIPNLLILVLNWVDIQSIGGLGSEGIAFGPMVLFGKTPRGAAAFLGLLLVPLLARSVMPSYTNWLTRYIAVAILLIFNPFVIDMLGGLAKLLTWRVMWALPVPALLAIGVVSVMTKFQASDSGRKSRQVLAIPAVFMCLAIVFIFSGKPTIAGGGVFIALGQPKVVPLTLPVAHYINEITEEEDLVLAPYQIAVVLSGLHNAPYQVAVRPIYIDHMQMYWSPEEAAARKRLQRFVSKGSEDPGQWKWVIQEIDRRSVNVVVLVTATTAKEQDFREALRSRGFILGKDEPVEIWVRH
jgi:hypothetical protein